MLTSEFDFYLPDDLIAKRPLPQRDASRMLVVHRAEQRLEHRMFREFPDFVRADDLVVLNDARVARARFFSDDGKVEVLRLEALTPLRWRCMVKPGRRLRGGHSLRIGGITGTVDEVLTDGTRMIAFAAPVDEVACGHLALPPYMKRPDDAADAERYQTVFARCDRCDAVAAPTAGLHFTPEMLTEIRHTRITLHVGPGTFQPVKAERVEDHVMHAERYEITTEAAALIESAPRRVAVGTTVARVLEHCASEHGRVTPHAGATCIFLHPPCAFRRVDSLLTNFHLPRSTLFMLVCAFGGTALLHRAYDEAVRERYRFYSYGDCMLLL